MNSYAGDSTITTSPSPSPSPSFVHFPTLPFYASNKVNMMSTGIHMLTATTLSTTTTQACFTCLRTIRISEEVWGQKKMERETEKKGLDQKGQKRSLKSVFEKRETEGDVYIDR